MCEANKKSTKLECCIKSVTILLQFKLMWLRRGRWYAFAVWQQWIHKDSNCTQNENHFNIDHAIFRHHRISEIWVERKPIINSLPAAATHEYTKIVSFFTEQRRHFVPILFNVVFIGWFMKIIYFSFSLSALRAHYESIGHTSAAHHTQYCNIKRQQFSSSIESRPQWI